MSTPSRVFSLKVKLAVPILVSLLGCLSALSFALESNNHQIAQLKAAQQAVELVRYTQPWMNAVVLELNQRIYPVGNFKSRLEETEKFFTAAFEQAPPQFRLKKPAAELQKNANEFIKNIQPTKSTKELQEFLDNINAFYWSIIDQSGLALPPSLEASYLLSTGTQGMPELMQNLRDTLQQLGLALLGTVDKEKTLGSMAILKNSANRLDWLFTRRASKDHASLEEITQTRRDIQQTVNELEPKIVEMTSNLELGFEYIASSAEMLNESANKALSSFEHLAAKDLTNTELVLQKKQDELQHKGNMLLIGAGIAIVLVIGATASILRNILNSVRGIQQQASSFAQGDLTQEFQNRNNDEISDITQGLNQAQNAMRNSLQAIGTCILSTEEHAQNLTRISSTVDNISKDQSTASETLSNTFHQLNDALNAVFEQLDTLKHLAQEGEHKSTQGKTIADNVNNNSAQLAERAKQYQGVMQDLSNEAKAIQAVTSVIDELADRTNLLALNASIEAARAGEQGRGFAVVADEVRALADQTSQATQKVRERLETLAKNANSALLRLLEWMKIVDESHEQAEHVIGHIGDLGQFAHHTSNSIQQIAYMLQGPEKSSKAIGEVIDQLNALIQQGEGSAHELLECATSLQLDATQAGFAMKQFKIR